MTRSLFALLALAGSASAQNWFGAPELLPGNGELLVAADLDLDGDVDLLQYEVSLMLRVLENDGTGRFTLGSTMQLAPRSTPTAERVHVGDVDGDGLPDIVCQVAASTIGTLLPGGFAVNRNLGGGAFGPPTFVPAGDLPRDTVIGDADGDGDVEIGIVYGLLGNQDDAVAWFDYVGGVYVSSAVVQLGNFATSLATADWTGDGRADLATALAFSNGVVMLPTVAGAPTVGPSLTAVTGSGFSLQVYAADVDGDGDEDIVATDYTLDETFLTVYRSDGAGGLQAPVHTTLAQGVATDKLLFADWDGDGDDDLIARPFNFGSLTPLNVYEALGDGTWVERFGETRYAGNHAAVVDLDGDGGNELVVGRTIVYGDGSFASVYPEDYDYYDVYFLRALDWEGDGDLDLYPLAPSVARFEVQVNDGTGTFTGSGPLLPLEVTGQAYQSEVAFVDVDGDGVRDLITGSTQFLFGPPPSTTFLAEWRYLGDGAGNLVPSGNAAPPVGTDMKLQPESPVDIDGDGDLDLVVENGGIWVNNGNGVFSAHAGGYAGIRLLDTGDFDGDGDQDLLTLANQFVDPDLVVQVNQGGGTFVPQVLLAVDDIEPSARFADLDDDGDLDVVGFVRFSSLANNRPFLLENLGGGAFAAPVTLPFLPMSTAPARFLARDVDLDGLTDLVVLPTEAGATNELRVFRRTGPGLVYEPARAYLMNKVFDIADLDGDGDQDVVGATMFRGTVVEPPAAGGARQFGAAVAGTGGALPLLGTTGPLDVGATTELRVRHALGGTAALLAVGTNSIALPNLPFAGLTLYVGGSLNLFVLTLGGTPGAPAEGSLDLPVTVDISQAGTTRVLQLFPVDAASPNGILTQSNALELTFGF